MRKTVLITGAGSGLGRELALKFVEKGYALVLVSRTLVDLKETAVMAGRSNVPVQYFVVDVSRLGQIEELKKKLVQKGMKIDILINNAGVGFFGNIRDTPIEKTVEMMNVNYFGSVYFTKIFLEDLIGRKGNLVFINTVAGKILVPKFSAYSPSKAALDFFARALSKELEGKVKVTSIYSGPIKTGFWDDKSFNSMKRRFFFKEPGYVADKVVKAVLKGRQTAVVPSWLNLLLLADKISSNFVYWLFKKIYNI